MFKGINVDKPKYDRLQPIEMLEEAEEHTETLTACNSFGWLLLLRGLRKKKRQKACVILEFELNAATPQMHFRLCIKKI